MVGIVWQSENEIRFSIDMDNLFDEMNKVHEVARKKFGENYVLFWEDGIVVVLKLK